MRSSAAVIILIALLLGFSAYAAFPQLSLSFADIRSPAFHATDIKINFVGPKTTRLNIQIGQLVAQEKTWRDLRLSCSTFQVTDELIHCGQGKLQVSNTVSFPLSLHFLPKKNILNIEVKPDHGERWQLALNWGQRDWRGGLTIQNGQVGHISKWLSDQQINPAVGQGVLNGYVKLSGHQGGLSRVIADLSIQKFSFSDQEGLHAGENINLLVKAGAKQNTRSQQWAWRSDIAWKQGGIFWQPLYFEGKNHRLSLAGTLDQDSIHLQSGNLALTEIGAVDFSGSIAREDNALRDVQFQADNLVLSALYEQVLKHFLAETAVSELDVSGTMDVSGRYSGGADDVLLVGLQDVSLVDRQGRFAINRINAHIPWEKARATIADISLLNGHLLHIPLGAVRVPLEMNNLSLTVPQLVLPILDGSLSIKAFKATLKDTGWVWQFSGELFPLSMDQLTETLGVQKMHGALSGEIPKVSYDGQTVKVDGALFFNVFDGTIVAKNLTLLEPLGIAPRLKVDLGMRNLDLELLTRAFSFGKVEGRVDMKINRLELVNWMPVKFNAHLYSSPGDYSRRISQAAIENISALGGASASAAIQRSVLRFFEEFRYSRIGWRCVLRRNICYMSGIEPKSQGYLLVEGGGVPAITVMGYNNSVDWRELINRLKRITQGGSPVIQ